MYLKVCHVCGGLFNDKSEIIAWDELYHYECLRETHEKFRLAFKETIVLQTILDADHAEQQRYAKFLRAERLEMLAVMSQAVERIGYPVSDEERAQWKAERRQTEMRNKEALLVLFIVLLRDIEAGEMLAKYREG